MSSESDDQTINLPEKGPDDAEANKRKAEAKAAESASDADIEIEPTLVAGSTEQVTLVTDNGGAANNPAPAPISGFDDGDATLVPEDATTASPIKSTGGQGAPAAAAAHVFANRFEVVALLGEGGMGRVYQVRDRQIEGREVALKVLRPKFSRNSTFRNLFFQEIQAAQKFVSEQVNQVRDTGQMEDGRLFLTMDLVSGESLRDLMKREGQMNTRHALEVTRQILLALNSGHEQGFVHRDIKPPNVMLASQVAKTDDNPYGIGVRLLDFGIAALAAEVGEGAISGTPQYMSPEQSKGERMDARSDLFSVGIVLYEMLSGSRPFEGKTLQEISTALVETQVAPMVKNLDNLKPAIQKILRKALEKDRDKRFQSAKEFIEAIERSKAYRMPTGAPAWVSGLLVVSLGGVGTAGWFLYNQHQTIGNLRSDVAAANSTANERVDQARSEEVTNSENLRLKLVQGHELIVEGLKKENRDLNAQLSEGNFAKQDDARDEDRVATLEDQVQQLMLDREEALGVNERQAEKIAELERAKEELEAEQRRFSQERSPVVKAATGLDKMLTYAAAGSWGRIKQHVDSLEADDIFDNPGIGGLEQLMAYGRASGKVQEYQDALGTGATARIELLTEASNHAQEAFDGMELFKLDASSWITWKADNVENPPPRHQDFLAAIVALQAQIESHVVDHEENLTRAFDELIANASALSPTELIQAGELHGWDKFKIQLSELITELSKAESNGALDLGKLLIVDGLEVWGTHVTDPRSPITGRESSVPSDYADRIKWFYFAKLWYDDENTDAVRVLELPDSFDASSSPESDWKSVLALQTQIYAAIPNIDNHLRYYRRERRGKVSWVRDSISTPTKGSNKGDYAWKVARNEFFEDGPSKKDNFSLQMESGILLSKTEDHLFNLFNPDAMVGLWAPSGARPDETISNRLPKDSESQAFATKYSAGLPCLVVEGDESVERWYSPEIGPVYEVSSSKSLELFNR